MRICRWLVAAAMFGLALCGHAAENKYIRAVTYFGDAWPVNYWNSDTHRAAADFQEIQADGFNAVILVLPWGEFQPMVKPVHFNDDAYARLTQVCRVAKARGLRVFMRVSYLWDMYPGEQLPDIERANQLLTQDTLLPAWQQYLRRVRSATDDCAEGSFISWEDYWHIIPYMSRARTAQESAKVSRQLGFDAWLKKQAPGEYRARHAADAKRFGAYPIPDRKSPDFRLVFQWFDERLMRHLMPALASSLPQASIEARVDEDPIYDGDKLIGWYSHNRTFTVKSSPYLMTYWAPAMGAQNKGEKESAKTILERFSGQQKRVADETNNKIFIEQFLFTDNTPSMAMNAAILPDQVSAFLKGVAAPMLAQTSGYALWGARDYEASAIFNGFFSLGTLDWKFEKGAKLVSEGDAAFAQLPPGATVTQAIPLTRDHFRASAQATTLRLRTTGPGQLSADYAGVTREAKLGAGEQTTTLTFPVAGGDSALTLTGLAGTPRVGAVYLSTYSQLSQVRDAQGHPGPHLADIRALNQAIATGAGLPDRLAAEDQTIARASGVSYPERDGARWYAWAGPQVQARVFARGPAIQIRGYIKPSMFGAANGCTLRVYADDSKVLSKTFRTDGPIELTVPLATAQVDAAVDLRLTSSCSLNPKQRKTGDDDRTLSYVLEEINAGPAAKGPARPQ